MDNSSLTENIQDYIKNQQLFQPQDKILLAVSGGKDSLVMAELFRECGWQYGIAHCNFQLRGGESERDEDFVQVLAEKHEAPYWSIRFNTEDYAAEKKISIQVAARELRYEWLEKVRQQHHYTFIATAHHADDNIETLLMNFFKGCGIAGLHGILPKQGKIIRPLLFTRAEEIKDYIKLHSLKYVEDSSNLADKYTRNFFRHNVIPLIKEAVPDADNNLTDNIERFKEAEILYRQAVEQHRKKLLVQKGEQEWQVPIAALLKTVPLQTVAYELLKPFNFSFSQCLQIISLLESESGRMIRSTTHRLIRDRKWLIITPLAAEAPEHVLIEAGDNKINTGDIKISINELPIEKCNLKADPQQAFIDKSKLEYPLLLRKWRTGDYFYPFGMKLKKKKLSRFFVDQKLSIPEKENVWILESNKKIIWVVGYRIDERFKITGQTKEVLHLRVE